ncbi:STE3-domain-containing protein [Mycena sanguinolenta]|uniref:STE3-domain-containing protein n=1 Tax=Mycena sanguinolenta TaxID=230812 RepID=A0A8H6Z8D2_9AGAR|nr:STE3-domain-containing protein [Mycena sanguinolenta]
MHHEFVPVAFIAAFSLFLALPPHWRARNVATLSIIAWLFVTNIIFAVDALIWGNSDAIVAVVWCDITTKILIGSSFALPAACLCICIHLEQVSSVRAARTTAADKRRRQIFEASMCFGLPLFFMALHYVVQGHRFDIIEQYGCRPTTYSSILAIMLISVPPLILGAGALVFAALALRHFLARRLTFLTHLSSSPSGLTPSRYIRLILMSSLQMVWALATTLYNLVFTLRYTTLRPYTSWADVHSGFSRVAQFPTIFIPAEVEKMYHAAWWVTPASTAIFVLFFAFGHEAMEDYKRVGRAVVGLVRRTGVLGTRKVEEKRGIKLPSFVGTGSAKAAEASTSYPTSPTPTKVRPDEFPGFDEVSFGDVSEASTYPYSSHSAYSPSTYAHPPPPPPPVPVLVGYPTTPSTASTSTIAFAPVVVHAPAPTSTLPQRPRLSSTGVPRPVTYPSFAADVEAQR